MNRLNFGFWWLCLLHINLTWRNDSENCEKWQHFKLMKQMFSSTSSASHCRDLPSCHQPSHLWLSWTFKTIRLSWSFNVAHLDPSFYCGLCLNGLPHSDTSVHDHKTLSCYSSKTQLTWREAYVNSALHIAVHHKVSKRKIKERESL